MRDAPTTGIWKRCILDIDNIEYRLVSGSSPVGGFEVRNKHTGSLFRPVNAYAVDGLRYFSFTIFSPGLDRALSGSFCEETSIQKTLPPDCPPALQERFRQLPAARQFCRYSKITDFQIDDGPDPDQLDADGRGAVLAEILFFYNASQLAENDYNDRKLQRVNPEAHARKKARETEVPAVAPGMIDFQPACCPALFARFVNMKDGRYVRINK